jgi:hypothetical protein
LFGDAIDPARVRIVRRRWWPFQPRFTVMAPCGNVHFHPQSPLWSDDFSAEPIQLQGLFVHEMTHVWQSQRWGRLYLPLHRHPFCRYRYTYRPGRRFERYGIEQQAEIVRHAFLRRRGVPLDTAPTLADLEAVLPFGRSQSRPFVPASESARHQAAPRP